jgi:carotenoid cleavage dioxygenase-like enzyme
MVHDVTMSENYLIFVIPPVKYDLPTLMSGKASPADALRTRKRSQQNFDFAQKTARANPSKSNSPPRWFSITATPLSKRQIDFRFAFDARTNQFCGRFTV